MTKEEILSKAQQEGALGVDEGTKHMKNYGRITGQIMFSAVFCVIALLSIITKNQIDYGVRAMLMAYIAGETYVEWKFKKSKVCLFFSIAAGFNTILALIEVACNMLGVSL